MKRIDITNGIMRIDTNTETFDIQKIQNRRFQRVCEWLGWKR